MASKNKEILDELAFRDFGTANVPSLLRGKARALAERLGCSPREALDKLMAERAEREKNLKVLRKKLKRSRRSKKKAKFAQKAKKSAEVGRPTFRGLVSGGLPGLGKRR